LRRFEPLGKPRNANPHEVHEGGAELVEEDDDATKKAECDDGGV
jgi:hypothetical protein